MQPVPRPSTYHHGHLRQTVLDTAIALITKNGVDRFSVREVARLVGVDSAAVFRHFASRAELLLAVAAKAFEVLGDRLERAATVYDTPSDRLRALGRAYVEFAVDEPLLFQLMFRRAISPTGPDETNPAFGTLLRAVQAAHHELGLGVPARLAALAAWASVHGIAALLSEAAWQPEPAERAAVLDTLLTASIRGLQARPGPLPP